MCEDPEKALELLLFVDDGWLAGVEIVYHGAEPPREFPPPETFLPAYQTERLARDRVHDHADQDEDQDGERHGR
jgi:hypothetical protein